ncbi:putative ABC transport system permease protein [Crossiella equi]|uniref:ABC transport system permease protein n=1 Tax=Crossiella equi TaxID=130796 RepID=A0ABS5APF8_9PSEU|nr:FtsX-like permease family protein [Crossiella equi]MBP2478451.1 putative ABC transport system permease protein [Crossiella equi]
MITLALRSLRARWSAALASVLAVLVGSALGAAALVIGQSADQAAAQGTLSSWRFRQADLLVRLPSDATTTSGLALPLPERPRLSQEQLDRLRGVPGVREVTGENPFPAYVTGDSLVGSAGTRSWGHPWTTATAEPFTLSAGRAPSAATDVVVGRSSGRQVGDEVVVTTAQGPRGFTVSGVGDWPGSTYEHALFFTPAMADQLGGAPVLALLRLDPGTVLQSVVDGVRAALPGAVVHSGSDKGRALVLDRSQAELSSGTGTFIGTIAASALVIAVFVISSTLSVSVLHRRRELALLRSVGASTGRVRLLVLGEAGVIGVLAGAFGGLAGIGVAELAIRFFAAQGLMPATTALVVGPMPFLVGGGVAVLAAVLAGVLPAWRASRTAPGEALRTAEVPPAPPRRGRVPWGVLNLVVAALFLGSGVVSGSVGGTTASQTAPVLVVLAAPFLLLAAVLLGRYLLGGLLTLLGPLLRRCFGGFVGEREIRGDLDRAVGVSTPVALMVGFACLMLFQDVATFQAKARNYDARLTADVVVGGTEQLGLPGSVAEAVAGVPGVRAATGTVATNVLPLEGGRPSSIVDSMGVEPGAVPAVFDLPARSGSWQAFDEDSIAVSENVAKDHGWQAGQEVGFLLADGTPVRAEVAVVYQSGSVTFAATMLPQSVVRPHLLEPLDGGVYVSLAPGADRAAVVAGLEALRVQYPALRVLSREEHLADVARQSSGDNWIMYLVVVLIAGYAGLAAVNVLIGSAMARRHRFALLRLAGARTSDVVSSVVTEVGVTVLSGILTGTAVAAVVLVGYGYVFTGELWLPIPLGEYLVICGAAVLVGLVGGVLPARLALRTKALDLCL